MEVYVVVNQTQLWYILGWCHGLQFWDWQNIEDLIQAMCMHASYVCWGINDTTTFYCNVFKYAVETIEIETKASIRFEMRCFFS